MANKIIKFYNDGCKYCVMVDNYLGDKGVEVESIHVFNEPEKASKYDVGSVPTTFLIEGETIDGKVIDSSIGFNPPELERLIEQL
jgi:glutaredoxin